MNDREISKGWSLARIPRRKTRIVGLAPGVPEAIINGVEQGGGDQKSQSEEFFFC